MIHNEKRLEIYLDSLVDGVFKILPLYEEENVGLGVYVESLLFELYGLDKAVSINDSAYYTSLLSILEHISSIVEEDGNRKVIKRELFKCIRIIKSMIRNIEEGE